MQPLYVLGIIAPIVAYASIGASIYLSPWFNWFNNALSDLGNTANNGRVAWIYDGGLIAAGVSAAVLFAQISVLKPSWEHLVWSIPGVISSADLALIGIFNETYGRIHGIVSTVFFLLITVTLLIFSYTSFPMGVPRLGALSLALGIASGLVWLVRWPWRGVAIQETIASLMLTVLLISVSLKRI